MSIDKTMRLEEDLKVDANFDSSDANFMFKGKPDSVDIEAYKKYYDKITK